MKVLLCLLIFSGSAYLGWTFGKKYRRKERFFQDLSVFCKEVKSRISFLRLKLADVLSQAEKSSSDFGAVCGKIRADLFCGDIEKTAHNAFDRLGYLKDSQKDMLCGFFSMLGSSDAASQTEQICGYEKIFEGYLEEARGDAKTKGKLCPKLGVFAGLFAVILFL